MWINKIIRDILIGVLGVVLVLAAYPLVDYILAPVLNELVISLISTSLVALVGGFIYTFIDQTNIDYKKLVKVVYFLGIGKSPLIIFCIPAFLSSSSVPSLSPNLRLLSARKLYKYSLLGYISIALV